MKETGTTPCPETDLTGEVVLHFEADKSLLERHWTFGGILSVTQRLSLRVKHG
jgi:hypothetical protein